MNRTETILTKQLQHLNEILWYMENVTENDVKLEINALKDAITEVKE